MNKWDLNLNVKKGIIERAQLDLQTAILDYDIQKESREEMSN